MVSSLTVESLIHFEFSFLYCIKIQFSFILECKINIQKWYFLDCILSLIFFISFLLLILGFVSLFLVPFYVKFECFSEIFVCLLLGIGLYCYEFSSWVSFCHSHRSEVFVFSFSFVLRLTLISSLSSLFTHSLLNHMLFCFHVFVVFFLIIDF